MGFADGSGLAFRDIHTRLILYSRYALNPYRQLSRPHCFLRREKPCRITLPSPRDGLWALSAPRRPQHRPAHASGPPGLAERAKGTWTVLPPGAAYRGDPSRIERSCGNAGNRGFGCSLRIMGSVSGIGAARELQGSVTLIGCAGPGKHRAKFAFLQ